MKVRETIPSSTFTAKFLFSLIISFLPLTTWGIDPIKDDDLVTLTRWINSRVKSASISVIDVQSGKSIFDYHGSDPLKPASVQKLITSSYALRQLGPEYTFGTEVLAEGVSANKISHLILRGGGDPTLTIESLWLLVRRLHAMGITKIGRITLDDSAFVSSSKRSGIRAYQSGSSALAFNFNSTAFMICPGVIGKSAAVVADPWEADLAVQDGVKTTQGETKNISAEERITKAGKHISVVQGKIGSEAQCQLIYRSVEDPRSYLATVIKQLLLSVNISVAGPVQFGITPIEATLLFRHNSKPLTEIIKELNHFSNNFTAEQLLYLLGDKGSEFTVGRYDRELALTKLEQYLISLGITLQQFSITDGSGLSHQNKLSALALSTILVAMKHNALLQPDFEASLPIANRSGTLKSRTFTLNGATLRGKTGSLDGVTSLAGYITLKSGKAFAFSIIQNNVYSRDAGHAFDEEFVRKFITYAE